jgi:hypothetical protein
MLRLLLHQQHRPMAQQGDSQDRVALLLQLLHQQQPQQKQQQHELILLLLVLRLHTIALQLVPLTILVVRARAQVPQAASPVGDLGNSHRLPRPRPRLLLHPPATHEAEAAEKEGPHHNIMAGRQAAIVTAGLGLGLRLVVVVVAAVDVMVVEQAHLYTQHDSVACRAAV